MKVARILVGIAIGVQVAWAQPSGHEPILQGRPDVVIRIRKSTVGADYVEILMVKENYPRDLLEKQCARVSEELGAGLRGLVVSSRALGGDPKAKAGRVVYASFATDGVIQESGVLRILPFARAFANAPEPHTIHTLAIVFEGVRPVPGVTVQQARTESAVVQADYDATLPQVEYRVALLTQDPSAIQFPETLTNQTETNQQNGAVSPSIVEMPRWLLGAIVGGAALVGALVYFALRPRPATRRARTETRHRRM
jgi:hypothetical protein